jgi:organic hydroperoxide reductase OsmC/OhrA
MSIPIRAHVKSSLGRHDVLVATADNQRAIAIPAKATGLGSSVNGGELLFAALATCYVNDVYREAAKRAIRVESVEVEVRGEFGAEGEPARDVTYSVKVHGDAGAADLRALVADTDRVAEIQNTLRAGVGVTLAAVEVVGR